jgi:hypothetical protein
MTSYNPLPSHLKAVQEELSGGSAPTPTNGGTVETGMEWDFIIDKQGRRRYVEFYMSKTGSDIRDVIKIP